MYRCRVGVRLACVGVAEGFIVPGGADLAAFWMKVSMDGNWLVFLMRCPISVV